MKSRYFKLMIAGFFLQSNIGIAQSGVNLNNSNNQVQSNIEKDEVCTPNPRPESLESHEYWYDEPYNSCLARNRRRAEIRAYALRGKNDAQEVLNGTLKEPTNNCKQDTSSGSYDYEYTTCMQHYAAEKREYDRKAEAARLAKAEEEKSKAADADPDKSKLKDTSATGSMAEIQQKNEEGNTLYTLAAAALAGLGAYKFAEAQGCTAQCGALGGGCCAMAPGLFAAGAAFMLLNGKANNQADQHRASANEACNTYNQLSSSQKDCSGTTTTRIIPPVSEWYDGEGKCKPTAPPECKNIAGTGSGTMAGKIPSNCKDASGRPISCVTAGMSAFKQNPDGSVKVKTPNGYKTYKTADFADKKSMMAAGMTAAQADSLMDQLYGNNSILAKAGLEAKELAKDSKKFSDFTSGNSGPSIVNIDESKNANKKFGEKLNSSEDSRRPSSEGLTREFNGELIGAAGDDIFTMMKRRYNLKAEQDTFISP